MSNEVRITVTVNDQASKAIDAVEDRSRGLVGTLEGMRGPLLAVSGGLLAAGGASVKFASDLHESRSAMEQVFGQSAAIIHNFAEGAAGDFNVTKQAAFEYTSQLGGIFKASGLAEEGAAGMSVEMVKLAADMSSMKDLDFDVALEKIRAGLVGEAEPLRTVGVLLSEAAVQAKAMELGIGGANGQLTEAEKVQARYAIILDQTADMQGDVARTSESFANQLRNTKQEASDAAAELGTVLLPMATRLVATGGDLVSVFGDMPGPLQTAVVGAGAMTAGLAALGLAIPPLVTGFTALRTAVLAANLAMLANPVTAGLVIAAAAGMGVAWLKASNESAKMEQAMARQTDIARILTNTTYENIQANKVAFDAHVAGLEAEEAALVSRIEAAGANSQASYEMKVRLNELVDELNGARAAQDVWTEALDTATAAEQEQAAAAAATADEVRNANAASIDRANALAHQSSAALAASLAERILQEQTTGIIDETIRADAARIKWLQGREETAKEIADELLGIKQVTLEASASISRTSGVTQSAAAAERELQASRTELFTSLDRIQKDFLNEQVNAYLEGGDAQVAIVEQQQAEMMASAKKVAQELRQTFGMDLPNALGIAMGHVRQMAADTAASAARAAKALSDAVGSNRAAALEEYGPGGIGFNVQGRGFGIGGIAADAEAARAAIIRAATSRGEEDMIPDLLAQLRQQVPGAASGAIVMARPGGTLVNVGEGGDNEAIVPLDGRGMGMTVVVHQHVHGSIKSEREVARDAVAAVKDAMIAGGFSDVLVGASR